jgi:predicted dehydrogenase
MGAEHAAAYRAIENTEVVGVCSRSRGRSEATAQICRAKPVTDPFALLDDRSVNTER